MHSTPLQCACGQVRLEVRGRPILSAECLCESCRVEGERIARLTGAPQFRAATGGTPFVLFRKDRVDFREGHAHLRELRRTPQATTRRVVATCCNTPVFLEFERGHWLSLYGCLWPTTERPSSQMRTMAADHPEPASLPKDVPNLRSHSAPFMFRLLGAWVAMGLRQPRIEVGREALEPGSDAS